MIERLSSPGHGEINTLILQALVRKLIDKNVLTADDVRALLFDAATRLDVLGGEQTPQAARMMVQEELAPAFLGAEIGRRMAEPVPAAPRPAPPPAATNQGGVSNEQLSRDMQAHARQLVDQAGLVPQAQDRPPQASDLLFYLSQTSIPMADFLRRHGLFMDGAGLHFDLAQFGPIRELAGKVINRDAAVWKQLDLSEDEDADNDGNYILTALAALELMYGPRK